MNSLLIKFFNQAGLIFKKNNIICTVEDLSINFGYFEKDSEELYQIGYYDIVENKLELEHGYDRIQIFKYINIKTINKMLKTFDNIGLIELPDTKKTKKKLKEKEKEVEDLKEKYENEIKELNEKHDKELATIFSPNGSVYNEVKEHFETIK